MLITSGQTYEHEDFSHQQLSQEDLSACEFVHCNFTGANLRAADCTEASFDHCQFNNQSADDPADLSQAKLRECQFKHCNLSVVDLVRCSAYDVQFLHCQMQGSDLSKSDFCLPVGDARLAAMTMQQCNFSFGNLSQCYLNKCEISDSRLLEACFDYTDLSEATLTNNNLHNLVATGLEIWGADLSGSEFNNLNPQNINLDQVTMTPEQLTMLADCLGIVVNFD